jgi:hypothetical protein
MLSNCKINSSTSTKKPVVKEFQCFFVFMASEIKSWLITCMWTCGREGMAWKPTRRVRRERKGEGKEGWKEGEEGEEERREGEEGEEGEEERRETGGREVRSGVVRGEEREGFFCVHGIGNKILLGGEEGGEEGQGGIRRAEEGRGGTKRDEEVQGGTRRDEEGRGGTRRDKEE